jgi:transposase
MMETTLPLAPDPWATVRALNPAPLREQLATLRRENAALRAQDAALQARIHELAARLGQNASNSSHLPSSDPPQAPPKRRAVPSGRKRGGNPDTAGPTARCCRSNRWMSS